MRLELVDSIKKHEGFRAISYKDHLGYDTIGYGTLIDKSFGGINEYEATLLLNARLEGCMNELNEKAPVNIRILPDKLRDVLYEMAYQMGVPKLLGFKKMWHAINRDDIVDTIKEMLDSKWAKQTPERAEDMTNKLRGL